MTAPSESFAVFLGVDPSIKVEYRPVKKLHEKAGFISKSRYITEERRTVITSYKKEPTEIVVFERLPKSDDATIIVKLVEPKLV